MIRPNYLLQNITSNQDILRQYLSGSVPPISKIKEMLFFQERLNDTGKPDHFYQNWAEQQDCWKIANQDKGYAYFLWEAFHELTQDNLKMHNMHIHVEPTAFTSWQDLITRVSPLVLQCAYLSRRNPDPAPRPDQVNSFARQLLCPNFQHSSLPTPHIPQLDHLVEKCGLCDLHIHLPNITEADIAWQHMLCRPHPFSQHFQEQQAYSQSFFSQVDPNLTAHEVCDRMLMARDLRWKLCATLNRHFFQRRITHETKLYIDSERSLLHAVSRDHWKSLPFPFAYNTYEHPIVEICGAINKEPPLVQEAFFLIWSFNFMQKHPEAEWFARGFHVYLLLQGFMQSLMVQQQQQKGFDQFEKIIHADCRRPAEKDKYKERFFQLNGNGNEKIAFLEGRFAPKNSVSELAHMLRDIIAEHLAYLDGKDHSDYQLSSPAPELPMPAASISTAGTRKMELRLVVHFIKEKDHDFLKEKNESNLLVRHHKLRNKLKLQSLVLIEARRLIPEAAKYITGIDAANNEAYAGPEVFAPVFRYCRRHGISHFTFHAGEDFTHLLSGLRTIYEAATFLDMRTGDRIGHATAAGIDPELWINRMGSHLAMPRGEWLDNLVFAAHLLQKSHNPVAGSLLPRIRFEIEKLATEIYGNRNREACPMEPFGAPSLAALEKAWLSRDVDALLLHTRGDRKWDRLAIEDHKEYDKFLTFSKQQQAFWLFNHYHDPNHKDFYKKIIKVALYEQNNQQGRYYPLFSPADLLVIQNLVLEELHNRELVLESPMISNVRISMYQSPREHHLWKWLNVSPDSQNTTTRMPPVCLGTDDPGIFNTSIYNEYAHIFHVLTHEWGLSTSDAAQHLEHLRCNSMAYRFQESCRPVKTPGTFEDLDFLR
jgi:hypothetical protein